MIRRYPILDLERHVAGPDAPRPSAGELAEMLGVTRRTITRWRSRGLEELWADRMAVRLGVHASAIWGPAWWAGAVEEGAVA